MYAAIGGIAFIIYFGLFNTMERYHVNLTIASSIAYFTSTATHFLLNRYANFRQFDRAVHDQARTFITIVVAQWLVTVALVHILTSRGVLPIIAILVPVIVNLPIGFIANRYLTFGVGIVPRVNAMRKTSR
jgi:putative flippase GtrA